MQRTASKERDKMTEDIIIPKIKQDRFNKIYPTITITIIILLALAFIVLLSEMTKIEKNGIACQSNPFIYGAKFLSEHNNQNIECSCTSNKENFWFNEKGYYDPFRRSSNLPFNFT